MQKIVKELTQRVINKYSQQKEIEAYSLAVKMGLTQIEKILIEKWLKRKGKILDIGCAAGRVSIALAKLGFDVVGIDVAPKMIKTARLQAKKCGVSVKFKVKDAVKINFPSNSFDYVLMFRMIQHVPLRINRIKILKKIWKILKRGGILIFLITFIPKKNLIQIPPKKRLEEGDYFINTVSAVKSSGKAFWHVYKIKEVIKEIKSADFKIEEKIFSNDIEHGHKENIVFFVCKK